MNAPTFNQELFFDAIAERLHTDGILSSYNTPKGTEHKDWPVWTKQTHGAREKNTPGMVYHVGDVPYDINSTLTTTSQIIQHHDFPITNDDIHQETSSIREAIKHYMPDREFGRYLQFFSENLQAPSHKAALDKAFHNLQTQLNIVPPFIMKEDANQVKEVMGREHTPAVLTMALSISGLRKEAQNYPELILALAIYQAAHITYLSQLEAAIKRNSHITEDEQENATSVFKHSFSQFGEFVIFRTLLPLILLKRQEISPEKAKGKSEEELMIMAISSGWTVFRNKKLLLHDLELDNRVISGEAGAFPTLDSLAAMPRKRSELYILCPANQHLDAAQDQKLLEVLYSAIMLHRDRLTEPLAQAERSAREAIENAEKIYMQEIMRTNELAKTTRGGELGPVR